MKVLYAMSTALALSGLAGCVSQTAAPEVAVVEAVPFSIEATLGTFFTDNPSATRFSLLNSRNKGFRFYPDGAVDFVAFGASSNLTWPTRVTEVAGNRVCVAPSGGWTGACIVMHGTIDGTIVAAVTYGNNRSSRQDLVFSSD